MVKTDNRHYNNTSSNKNLHTELNLWLAFKENGEKPLLIGTAISKWRINNHEWNLFYHPIDYAKGIPFLLTYNCGSEHDTARFETIASAKYHLRKSDSEAKWKTNKLKKI